MFIVTCHCVKCVTLVLIVTWLWWSCVLKLYFWHKRGFKLFKFKKFETIVIVHFVWFSGSLSNQVIMWPLIMIHTLNAPKCRFGIEYGECFRVGNRWYDFIQRFHRVVAWELCWNRADRCIFYALLCYFFLAATMDETHSVGLVTFAMMPFSSILSSYSLTFSRIACGMLRGGYTPGYTSGSSFIL